MNIKLTCDEIKYYSAYVDDRVFIYEKHFADKNWDYYKSKEQLIFIGCAFYICVC